VTPKRKTPAPDQRSAEDLAEEIQHRLVELRRALKQRYRSSSHQVSAKALRAEARSLAEAWLTELAVLPTTPAIDPEVFANRTLDFESLLQASGRLAIRRVYCDIIDRITASYSLEIVVPLKRARVQAAAPLVAIRTSNPQTIVPSEHLPTVFVGHSFETKDTTVANDVVEVLKAIGLSVFTGEKAKADQISEKVKELIESQDIFVGVFTRRDKLHRKAEWTTTTWVIEEKTWAMARNKRIILMRESGVKNLGGFHADHEYIEFTREAMGRGLVKLLQMFDIQTRRLR